MVHRTAHTIKYYLIQNVKSTKVEKELENDCIPDSWISQFSHPVVSNFVTTWTAARQASLSLTISSSLPKFMFITLVMPSSHLIP